MISPPLGAATEPAWVSWRVDGGRLDGWLDGLAQVGADPNGGVSRAGFSETELAARAWIRPLMEHAGLTVRIDPAGNLIGERSGSDPSLPPILFGSHVDTVPNGGKYDGSLGTLAAIEVATVLAERGYANRHPLWITVWTDEERGLTGSRGFVGLIDDAELGRPKGDGGLLADQIRNLGGDPAALARYRHGPGSIAGYVELHIEQGRILEETGTHIGIVQGIVGIRSWDVTITGASNHAGTTPMDRRQNALLAAAELALAVDRIARREPGRQVGTVGRMTVEPGAQNVIPGKVSLSIEIRDLDMGTLARLWTEIEAEGHRIMAGRGTSWTYREKPVNEAAAADPEVCHAIERSAGSLGLTTRAMPSGAGHDGENLALAGPMSMIFVPSVGGISHSPRECTLPGDVANGANVLLQTVLWLDQA